MKVPQLRLAPTPSGYLHVGNVYNFLFNSIWAHQLNAKLLLRIDDLDAERTRPEYLNDIFRVLDFLQIEWHSGPQGPDDFRRHWSQLHRMDLYEKVLSDLAEQASVFSCRCSRSQIQAVTGGTLCHGHCGPKGAPGDSHSVWRLAVGVDETVQVADVFSGNINLLPGRELGCFVLRKRDGLPSYQVASLADDMHFGITHIARGLDLLPSTGAQLYMAHLLNVSGFQVIRWWHHGLQTGPEGRKLSKSAGERAVSLLEDGHDAAHYIRNFCRFAQIPEVSTMTGLYAEFPKIPV